jgi:hypothetical protein
VSSFAWGLWGALAFALTACGGGIDDAAVHPIEPGSGFKAEVLSGVTASLSIPDQVSPQAALIQGEVTLDNRAGDVQVVSVPRACDVLDWVILDAGGRPIMAKDPVACVDQPTSKALAPGGSLTERISIYLLPRTLQAGAKYVVDYRFWGQPARAEFTARK